MSRANLQSLEIADSGKEISRGFSNVHAEAQLQNQADVSQAHQFFQAQPSAELPKLNLTNGAESAAAAHTPGMESMLSKAAPGAEQALGAIAQPGGEPISPMIQMIMKMPGLTGVIDSFFEFLGALCHFNVMDALDPTFWAEHAMEALTALEDGAENMAVSLDLIPADGPLLTFNGQDFMPFDSCAGPMHLHSENFETLAPDQAANVGAPVDQAQLDQAMYENAGEQATVVDLHKDSLLDWRLPDNRIAVGDSGSYGMSSAAYQQSTAAGTPPPATTSGATPPARCHPVAHHAPAGHGAEQQLKQSGGHRFASHHNELAQASHADHGSAAETANHAGSDSTDTGSESTDATSAKDSTAGSGSQYTVEKGDNLWDIARKQLGDGSRWHEIYSLNSDAIGSNPGLIQPGVELQLPGGDLASGDYIVQPGDNLWNIAEHNLGGGAHWGQIYQVNHDVIGGNPDLIHPGTHLQLGDGSGTHTIASAADSSALDHAAAPASDQAAAVSHPAAHAGAGAHASAAANHAQAADVGPLASSPAAAPHLQAQTPVADHTAVASNYPHSTAGVVRAQTPIMAPIEGAAPAVTPPAPSPSPISQTTSPSPANFGKAITAGAAGEHVINSSTSVPDSGQMFQSPDGSLFLKKPD